MEAIIRKASELGQAIRDSDIYMEYMEISSEVGKNAEGMKLLKEFMELTREISEKEKAVVEVEAFERERYRELIQKIEDNDMLKSYVSAQNDFLELMKKVENCII